MKAPVYERQYRRLAFANGRNGLVWIDVEKPAYHHLSQSEIASDVGGGGTIGLFMSREEMEVIDLGVPLLSMHSPFEMSSKVDVWDFYRTMSAFYMFARANNPLVRSSQEILELTDGCVIWIGVVKSAYHQQSQNDIAPNDL